MAIYNSSEITRLNGGTGGRGPGVSVTYVNGVLTLASNITLSSVTTDTLPLCYIPFSSYIADFKMFLPAMGASLVMNLQDTLATPTTYITSMTTGAAGGVIQLAGTTAVSQFATGTWGTVYGATARTLASTGNQVVVWKAGTLLQLKVTTSASATTGGTAINAPFIIAFAPGYDFGV